MCENLGAIKSYYDTKPTGVNSHIQGTESEKLRPVYVWNF